MPEPILTLSPEAGPEQLGPPTPDWGDLALVLTGGGARAAYQVGVLSYIAERFPELRIPILVGISAGAVNTAYLAAHPGTLARAVEELWNLWLGLLPERVFRVDASSLARKVVRSGAQLVSGGVRGAPRVQGMVDTAPLRAFLERALAPTDGELAGIQENLRRGTLRAAAVVTTSYTTGQTVVFVQGRGIETWERPLRRSVQARLGVEHVMASTALPFFFPAVQVGDGWYGDGGIRLTAPLSPALHLGAHKILAISTHYLRSRSEADRPAVVGYPPPAQVLGVLYNAIFLDLIDQDVLRMQRVNRLLERVPVEERQGMRIVDLLALRPSRDLGALAGDYEPRLPRAFRFLARGLGTRETAAPDLLSTVMFQPDYLRRLLELGQADARASEAEIAEFLAR
ncbi:MAG TPA: patatin-like phospholipase family protein [Longimicrobiaceae bacterium]|nr:patatin-like phospholipase family protein [Longimicrobiaceae bacterium]